jgi:outer membrane protein OmpA-like peptidoglycan-associated protein
MLRGLGTLLALLVLSMPVAVQAGYPDRQSLEREVARLEEYLGKAQASEGPQCAPEALGRAQSHLARAKEELEEGDLWAAEDAVRLCEKEADGIWERILVCGKDLDLDGVPDRKDRCPDAPETLNGYMDDDGCPDRVPQTAVLTPDKIELLVPVRFGGDDPRPLPDSLPVLREVARILAENPGLRLSVRAHMSDRMPVAQADALTGRRADAVRSFLVELGVAEGRLEAEGRGGREPLAANDSEWGRLLNERIEFVRIP